MKAEFNPSHDDTIDLFTKLCATCDGESNKVITTAVLMFISDFADNSACKETGLTTLKLFKHSLEEMFVTYKNKLGD